MFYSLKIYKQVFFLFLFLIIDNIIEGNFKKKRKNVVRSKTYCWGVVAERLVA